MTQHHHNERDTITDELRRLRILMFAPVCFPPAQPEAIVNANLALALKRAGARIDVITNPVEGYEWYPSTRRHWRQLEESVHAVPELRAALPNKVWARLQVLRRSGQTVGGARWAAPATSKAMALAAREPYDLVLSRALPHVAHLSALMFHRATRTPWIANWNDPQPWHKFPPPYGDGPSSRMTSANDRFSRAIGAHCAWHTFPCERLRRYMCSYMPGEVETRSSVVPHIATTRFSTPPEPHEGFSICYAGSLRPPRDPRVLLEGAKRFAQSAGNPEGFSVRFLVDRPEAAVDAARAVGAGDLLGIEPARPYAEVFAVLARSDVLAIIEAPVDEGIFLPSKFVDYVQTGRPILAVSPPVGTLSDLLSAHGGGLAVDGRSPEAVAGAIETFYRHWKAGTLDATYGSAKLLELFGEQQVLAQHMAVFQQVLAERSRPT